MKIKLVLAILTVGGLMTFAACNSNEAPKSDQKPATADTSKTASVTYICPMDSGVVQDAPGKCPKCGMELEKKQ